MRRHRTTHLPTSKPDQRHEIIADVRIERPRVDDPQQELCYFLADLFRMQSIAKDIDSCPDRLARLISCCREQCHAKEHAAGAVRGAVGMTHVNCAFADEPYARCFRLLLSDLVRRKVRRRGCHQLDGEQPAPFHHQQWLQVGPQRIDTAELMQSVLGHNLDAHLSAAHRIESSALDRILDVRILPIVR